MIIGITGKIGSGKSTLASYLQKKGYTEYSFAQPLKEIGRIFGFSDKQLFGSQQEKLEIHPYWKVSAREFLQRVGTDLFRVALPQSCPEMFSVWTRLFILKYSQEPGNYVISDVRFLDEAKTIKDLGGVLIRTSRNCQDSSLSGTEHLHVSEVEMSQIEVDFTIDNNLLSKEEAEKEINRILANLKARQE